MSPKLSAGVSLNLKVTVYHKRNISVISLIHPDILCILKIPALSTVLYKKNQGCFYISMFSEAVGSLSTVFNGYMFINTCFNKAHVKVVLT